MRGPPSGRVGLVVHAEAASTVDRSRWLPCPSIGMRRFGPRAPSQHRPRSVPCRSRALAVLAAPRSSPAATTAGADRGSRPSPKMRRSDDRCHRRARGAAAGSMDGPPTLRSAPVGSRPLRPAARPASQTKPSGSASFKEVRETPRETPYHVAVGTQRPEHHRPVDERASKGRRKRRQPGRGSREPDPGRGAPSPGPIPEHHVNNGC